VATVKKSKKARQAKKAKPAKTAKRQPRKTTTKTRRTKRTRPRRARAAVRRRVGHFDPAAQLDKLAADLPALAGPRARGPVTRDVGPRPAEVAGPALPADFFAAYTGEPVTLEAYNRAAQTLGCEVAAVQAVADVESRGTGFDAQRRPTILYERHVFSRCTVPKGKFDGSNPDLSSHEPYARGTFGTGDQQYVKLARAYALDPVAALKAPSWGMFQILGENHKACGFATVTDYVRAMTTSQVAHLNAFVAFVRSSPRMLQAIRNRDWATFASVYNGPGYATYQYDKKIAAAYARHASPAS
jgi:hypothetical protein